MSTNEIPAAADEIFRLISQNELDGTDNDLPRLIRVYQKYRINTPNKIAKVYGQLAERQQEALKDVGVIGNLEFKVRTISIK